MSAPRVHIIIVNWNGWSDTAECLDTLAGLDYPTFQIIISDNGSTDGSLTKASEWARDRQWGFQVTSGKDPEGLAGARIMAEKEINSLVFFQNYANLGFTGANNAAMVFSLAHHPDYLLLLNNDTLVFPDFLGKMVRTMEADPRIGLLGCKIFYADAAHRARVIWSAGEKWRAYGNFRAEGEGRTDGPEWTGVRETVYVCGCALMVRTAAARDIGLLDDRFFFLAEDFEYGLRARRRGWGVKVDLDASISHKVSRSSGNHSALAKYYFVRNTALARRLHFSFRENILFWICHPLHQVVICGVRELLTGRGRESAAAALGFLDFLTGRFGKCAYPAVNRPPRISLPRDPD